MDLCQTFEVVIYANTLLDAGLPYYLIEHHARVVVLWQSKDPTVLTPFFGLFQETIIYL